MRITFTLSDAQHRANDRGGVMIGLPISVQLDAGVLVPGQDTDQGGPGWFEPTEAGQTLLKPFSLERVAFSGRVQQMELWRSSEGVACQALLDCGLPVRCDLLDPDQTSGSLRAPYDLAIGDGLMGVASLNGLLALDPGDLLWQPVSGTIVDIQRLGLHPLHPAFGSLRWLQGLPSQSFAPDQVYVTMEI